MYEAEFDVWWRRLPLQRHQRVTTQMGGTVCVMSDVTGQKSLSALLKVTKPNHLNLHYIFSICVVADDLSILLYCPPKPKTLSENPFFGLRGHHKE